VLHEIAQTWASNKFLAYSTTHVEILNLISLCQTKSSLWFHPALPPFGIGFSESVARNPGMFPVSLERDICAKSASKEFPVHCIIGKAFFMCQKDRGGAEKVRF